MEKETDLLFIALEYEKNVPELDLHGVQPEEVEVEVFNFLLNLINQKKHTAQIIYGRGGAGILRQKTMDFLNKNMTETNQGIKLVKAWKESSLASAGGRCLVILED